MDPNFGYTEEDVLGKKAQTPKMKKEDSPKSKPKPKPKPSPKKK